MTTFTPAEREAIISEAQATSQRQGFTISRALVEMALDAEEDAAANGTDHWLTLEEVEAEYADDLGPEAA